MVEHVEVELSTHGEQESSMCTLAYVSAGCNRSLHCLSWGRNGLIAFGACNSVAIYNPRENSGTGRICQLLNKHSGRVICVHWIDADDGMQLVSGSADKSICIWNLIGTEWVLGEQLVGHKNAVSAITSTECKDEESGETKIILASSSADSTMIIWKQSKSSSGFTAVQTLTFGNGFALSLSMTNLPGLSCPLLACGCDDTNVHLFAERDNNFEKVQTIQGHEDWIQTIDFSYSDKETVFLVSGSKDTFIRIWKISLKDQEQKLNDELRLEEQKLRIKDNEYSIVLESVLIGHEGWVNGVRWKRCIEQDGKVVQPMTILSASMDKTMMTWQLDEETGVWMDTARVGEVGGNTLGFYGCAISPDGKSIIAHGFQGAFHLWSLNNEQKSNCWNPDVTISGHFGAVQDFDWDPENGEFLISVGTDQTARLHAPWVRNNEVVSWHEIARPQVHGYDMQCIAFVNRSTYASGSEEKVTRIFTAPKSFFDSLSLISKVESEKEINASLPVGASIPSLGLSNKAVFQNDLESWKEDSEDKSRPLKASAFASEDPAPYTPMSISCPPPEDVLLQNTLWPEVHKLYGHGFEVFCLACNPQGTVLASACKASKAEHANILLWDTTSWRQIGNLNAHALTVTQLAFSHSGNFLLSVSRDRTWALFESCAVETFGSPYALVQKTDKKTSAHSRIIWSCCWTPDDRCFATASRDKQINLWSKDTDSSNWSIASKSLTLQEPVTAVNCLPAVLRSRSYAFAAGMENGQIDIYQWNSFNKEWMVLISLAKNLCPTLAVKRLRWNRYRMPKSVEEDQDFVFQLAAGSTDSSLRVINVPLSLLSK